MDVQTVEHTEAPGRVLSVELAVLCRAGGRAYNEDACGHWHSDEHLCCVVADGAGGHGGGEVAARLAVRHIVEQFAAAPLATASELEDLLMDTNAMVIRHRADAEAQVNMHSTVVALFIDLQRGQALWGHAGDSRLYLFRDGRIAASTRDHSIVQSLVDVGMLRPEEMRTHPRRSELMSALGSEPGQLHLTALVAPCPLQPGDVFLLCTDGLWEFVEENDLCETLAQSANPQDWLAWLEQRVVSNADMRGRAAHDNFSGVAVWVDAAGAAQL